MESLNFIFVDGRFEILGFPDAVKTIALTRQEGKFLADLALHQADLEFALNCLEGINRHPTDAFIQQALWRSAVTHFVKCFSSGARRFLQPNQVLKGQPEVALWAFNYIKELRNKHLAHDDNSLSQSISGAIINNGKKEFKIEKIFALPIHAETLMAENYSNLKLLCDVVLTWVVNQFDLECDRITAVLEKANHNDLMRRSEPLFSIAKIEDIGISRSA
ncbi:hypothetical protein ASC94_29505 [Massilia sp. Root418]|nr:hypothetical protein ASC94_29505 [Massilia sp. Root418]